MKDHGLSTIDADGCIRTDDESVVLDIRCSSPRINFNSLNLCITTTMARKLLITSALSLLLAVHAPAKAQRTELIEDLIPAINPAFTSPSEHWADLLDVLPAVPATIEPFEAGWAFRSCSSSPTMYDYYNLFFEDCPEPWQVCLGKESSLSIEDVADVSSALLYACRTFALLIPSDTML